MRSQRFLAGILLLALAAAATRQPALAKKSRLLRLRTPRRRSWRWRSATSIRSTPRTSTGSCLAMLHVKLCLSLTPYRRANTRVGRLTRGTEGLFEAYPGAALQHDFRAASHGRRLLAYGHNVQTGYFTDKNGSRMDVAVRVTDVYRRIKGKWLIVHEHDSFPVDLATGKDDLTSKP